MRISSHTVRESLDSLGLLSGTKFNQMQAKNSTEDEDTLSKLIFDKLSEKNGISYEEVAREAFKAGRIKLSTKVLLSLV